MMDTPVQLLASQPELQGEKGGQIRGTQGREADGSGGGRREVCFFFFLVLF